MVPVSASLGPNDLLVLLGAGASVEANIPASATMIRDLERLLENPDSGWHEHLQLYLHIKSGILFGAGIHGKFGNAVNYNIEMLVLTLYELERNESHPIYPFIGSWNSRLLALAGGDLANVRALRARIVKQLQSWVQPERGGGDRYYDGLLRLQKEYKDSLRVFSLNYDLCVEHLGTAAGATVEGGFGPAGDQAWSWDPFREPVEAGEANRMPNIYLYKLHGSINWRREPDGSLVQLDYSGGNLNADDLEVIFGREFKLDAADPYLLYAYELRERTKKAKLILIVGYSFSDEHVNKILAQAMRDNQDTRLYVVDMWDEKTGTSEPETPEVRAKGLARKLLSHERRNSSSGPPSNGNHARPELWQRMTVRNGGAKQFFDEQDPFEILRGTLPGTTDPEIPF